MASQLLAEIHNDITIVHNHFMNNNPFIAGFALATLQAKVLKHYELQHNAEQQPAEFSAVVGAMAE